MRTSVFLSTLFLVATTTALAADNWPQFRGPTGDGHSDATGLPVNWNESENIKWKTPIHGRGWSSPVIWGDQIWLGTATDDGKKMSAICVHKDTGKILHDILLFENEKPRFCHAMNSYASPSPIIEDGRVYLHFGSYGTACIDTSTGKTIWSRRDLPCDHYRGPGSSPISFEDLLIVHYDGYDFQYIVALDKESGKTVWKRDRDIDYQTTNGDLKKAYCTPTLIEVDGKVQLVSPAAKATIAYEPRTGEAIWKVRYRQHSATARPLYAFGLVFLNTGFPKAELWAVRPNGKGDITGSHVAWRATKQIGSKPSQLIVDDLIYVVSDGGVLSCLEAKTGKEVWTARLGGKYSSSPLYADGHIYFFSHEGKTTVIDPGREYKEVAVNQLDDGFMASPAVTGKALILRTITHLYRIEK